MREVTIEELTGTWRSEDQHIRFDLAIRPDDVSFFTQIKLADFTVISEAQGTCTVVNNQDTNDASIWVDEHLELVIWQLALNDEEIILELKDQGRYRFKKIS